MRKYTIVLVMLLILVTAAPVAADAKEPVGERVNLYPVGPPPPAEMAAGEPFHISHGWANIPGEGPLGAFDFAVDVDGVVVDEDYVSRVVNHDLDPNFLVWSWVFNFPEGFPSGTYTFTGHWYAPCQYAVDELGYDPGPDGCAARNVAVETSTNSATIVFLAPPE